MKTLVVLGSDKITKKYVAKLRTFSDVMIVMDKSSNLKRTRKLLLKKRISLKVISKMFYSELKRKNTMLDSLPFIKSNSDLLHIIEKFSIERIFLFRAGLIINNTVLSSCEAEFLNIHCVRIPEYAGLGAIHKALENKDYSQCAVMHRVTAIIDGGEIIEEWPYTLEGHRSYGENEDIAYEAGMNLLFKHLTL